MSNGHKAHSEENYFHAIQNKSAKQALLFELCNCFYIQTFKSPIAGIFNWNLCLRNTKPKHYQLIKYSSVCKNIGPHGIDMQTSQQGTTINYNLRGSRKRHCLEETLPFFIPTLLKC